MGTLPAIPELLTSSTTGQSLASMARTLITRNQFHITAQRIVHEPTKAACIPHPGNPHSGIVRLGQLGNPLPSNGNYYESEDDARTVGGIRRHESRSVQDVIACNIVRQSQVLRRTQQNPYGFLAAMS